jgi:uncharacterized protein YutE (UPF0331/DUF86 family)
VAEPRPRRPLPKEIAQPLKDLLRHRLALRLILERLSRDEYLAAMRAGGADELLELVYPLERAVEVANNYTIALASRALGLQGIESSSAPEALRKLNEQGAISAELAKRLTAANRVRNEAQHASKIVRGAALYDVAKEQDALLEPFLKAYVRWLDELGFGRAASSED